MLKNPDRYVIAVKRNMRDQAPHDWVNQLEKVDGLKLVSKAKSNRVMVEANPKAIEVARTILSDYCYIEPLILHKPRRDLSTSGGMPPLS